MVESEPRCYEPNDLQGLNRSTLYDIVRKQKEHWPYETIKLNTNTKREYLVNALIHEASRFTTSVPRKALPDISSRGGLPKSTAQKSPTIPLVPDVQNLVRHIPLGFRAKLIVLLEAVTFFIQDMRLTSSKTSRKFSVPYVETLIEKQRWTVHSKTVIEVLYSHDIISGHIQLLRPDPVNKDYWEPFLICRPGTEVTATTPPEFSLLEVAAEKGVPVLYIRIESLTGLSMAPIASGSGSNQTHPNTDVVVSYLQAEIQKRSGYDAFFAGSKNHRLRNEAVVEYWAFAAGVLQTYEKEFCVASTTRIKRRQIMAALNMQETALGQAEKAHYWIQQHSDDFTIQIQLDSETSTVEGSTALFKLLSDRFKSEKPPKKRAPKQKKKGKSTA
ncbi:hypothetical protein C8J56DRAFT_892946 [Mycena floridula]|nr:hypothetical protein C8J56DRAFT_892946 [Mycena floridula]